VPLIGVGVGAGATGLFWYGSDCTAGEIGRPLACAWAKVPPRQTAATVMNKGKRAIKDFRTERTPQLLFKEILLSLSKERLPL
jgi:hypothetical protein